MKHKHDQGFSLIEILVAIVILTAIVVPTCSALLLSNEMDKRTTELMKAQLAVSSAVETLMAEGIPGDTLPTDDYGAATKTVQEPKADGEGFQEVAVETDRFPDVKIKVESVPEKPWFAVTVTSNDELVEVKTSVRAVPNGGAG